MALFYLARSRVSKLDSDAPEEISSGASESNLDSLLLKKISE